MPVLEPNVALWKTLEQQVQRYMQRRELWPDSGPLVIGTSGGADSTALALILFALTRRKRTPKIELVLAYFDHGLRPKEVVDRETAFVRGLQNIMAAPCYVGDADVRRIAKRKKISIEEAARIERYEFFGDIASDCGATFVAVGHTLSDQAETVLMHAIRGSGISGLGGMAPKGVWPMPGHPSLTLIRPLLGLTREETHAYCDSLDIEPMHDETNDVIEFTRNRIRHELMPVLKAFNPHIEEHLAYLASEAREITEAGNASMEDLIKPQKDGTIVYLKDFLGATHGVRVRAGYHSLWRAAGETKGFYSQNFNAVQRLFDAGKTGDSVDLPRGYRARRTRDAVIVELADPTLKPLPPVAQLLEPEAELPFGHLVVKAGATSLSAALQAVEVDAAAAAAVQVRRRRNGDRLQPYGMNGQTKKLQDVLVDAFVPKVERDRIPIFESERGIVWVGGLRIAEWARPQPGQPTAWLSFREAT